MVAEEVVETACYANVAGWTQLPLAVLGGYICQLDDGVLLPTQINNIIKALYL